MAHSLTHPHFGSKYHDDDAKDVARDSAKYDYAKEESTAAPATHAEPAAKAAPAPRMVREETIARRQYGGFNMGAAFFGWLVSTGLAVLLAGILSAAGAALTVTRLTQGTINAHTFSTIGFVSGVLFVVLMAVAYYAGGYVAGRMSRYDGARQGFGVWLIGLLATVILALVGVTLGARYNVFQQVNLPHIPVSAGSFTTGGVIASLAALLVSLLAALTGGKAGVRYHQRVDNAVLTTRTPAYTK